MPLLLPDMGLLFWMVLSFGIVFFIVSKWGFPIITQMVEERKEYITKSLQAADEVNRQLAGIKAQSEVMLEKTREEQLTMLRETSQIRKQILDEAKESAKQESQKILMNARKQINRDREITIMDIHNQVAIMAVDIAEKVLRCQLKEKDSQMDLVNRLIGEAKQAKWEEQVL